MYPLSEYWHDAEVLEGEPEHNGLELPKYSYPAHDEPGLTIEQYVLPGVSHATVSVVLKQATPEPDTTAVGIGGGGLGGGGEA